MNIDTRMTEKATFNAQSYFSVPIDFNYATLYALSAAATAASSYIFFKYTLRT